ncbi:hypothetical protein [Nonomuraea sp. NPDC050691]|uniref:imine reductase family protein n=1 Tax=Nonomuraea sp. NPDC050691 TaxID=3155661 RepID=UPI0033E1438E
MPRSLSRCSSPPPRSLGAAGAEAAAFTPIANQGIETVNGWLAAYTRQIDEGAYPAFDSTLDTHLGAMDHPIHESESLGGDADLPRFVKTLADRAAAGHGGEGYAAMIELFRKPAA